MSWADCLFGGEGYVRGHFLRGNHNTSAELADRPPAHKPSIGVPINMPGALLNTWTVKAFNTAIYHIGSGPKSVQKVIPYEPFFYPLDTIKDWNRMYGTRGFLQYQCVVPFDNDNAAIKEVFTRITRSGEGSFLVVLKTFGALPSPGMLSFPKPGVTLALDFPFHGARTLRLLEDLDGVVRASGGAVYPAKDARMSAESFQAFYPAVARFRPLHRPAVLVQFLAARDRHSKAGCMTTILIIGATSAIAQATARRFAAEGARFFLVGRDADKLAAVADDLRVRGAADAETYVLDLNDIEKHAAMIEAATAALGTLDAALIAHGTLGDQKADETLVVETMREWSTNATSVIALLTLLANTVRAAAARHDRGDLLRRGGSRATLQLHLRRGEGGAQRLPGRAARPARTRRASRSSRSSPVSSIRR